MDLAQLNISYQKYLANLPKFATMKENYLGKTQAELEYKQLAGQSNYFYNKNILKTFVKTETAYVLSNKISYLSKSNDKEVIKDIEYYLAESGNKHDQSIFQQMLIFGEAYELAFVTNGTVKFKVLSPLNTYIHRNDYDDVDYAMYIFTRDKDAFGVEKNTFVDVFTSTNIFHYQLLNGTLEPMSVKVEEHYFGSVPVSICTLSEDKERDTIYEDIKLISAAYNVTMSNQINEYSDFRNAYINFHNMDITPEDAILMKTNGIIITKGQDAGVKFIIKTTDVNVNSILDKIKSDAYEVASHIDTGEKLQSNTSGEALAARMFSLTNACKAHEDSLRDCFTNRLKLLFSYLKVAENKSYSWRDIQFIFTLNLPKSDVNMSQIVANLQNVDGLFSKSTYRSNFSFCNNPDIEEQKVKAEQDAEPQVTLDNIPATVA